MPEPEHRSVRTPDGRVLEVLVAGADGGLPLVWQHGSPSAAVRYDPLAHAAAARGLALVSYSRPGYATSTPQPGRRVADAAADVATVVDAVAGPASRFVTIGWSGGGPHAIACAALLPDRCGAAATLAGVAPSDAEGLDWLAGMGEENHVEFGAARAGGEILSAWLTSNGAQLASITPEQVAAGLGDLASAVDVAALTGDVAEYLARGFRRALMSGIAGWRDDDLAFVQDWGFDLASIEVPVSVWQGSADRMVPYEHGVWLAGHVAGARARLHDDEGHVSLLAHADRIMDDLRERAGR